MTEKGLLGFGILGPGLYSVMPLGCLELLASGPLYQRSLFPFSLIRRGHVLIPTTHTHTHTHARAHTITTVFFAC